MSNKMPEVREEHTHLPKKKEKERPSGIRSWGILLGAFVLSQIIFFFVDGTSWEPNMNDSGNILGRILESQLFTEWITIYSFPFFNLATTVFAIVILSTAVKEFLFK
ncbi:YfzA family protein [Bacillus horti]|uniref:YfzA-like protein n=1 Tax=Caldalkalibacillus horti TaxID=77523 RepID=A0ABT9VWM8_9BACI|nr:YfzA family protein [Bacillus horti]MDQ0165374.1 hypothetical protein [Bacillus horti]